MKRGDELIPVSKAAIPAAALFKYNNSKLTNVDNGIVESKIQFRNEKFYNNKKVYTHFIILSHGIAQTHWDRLPGTFYRKSP